MLFHDTAFCVTVAWGSPVQTGYFELEHADMSWAATEALKGRKLVCHNAKFDMQKLLLADILDRGSLDAGRVIDTECLAQLLDEHRKKGLKDLAESVLGLRTNEADALAKARRKLKLTKADGYDKLPRPVLVPYSLKDPLFTILLFRDMWPQVERRGLTDLFYSEMRLLLCMLDVESRGVRLDLDYLHRTIKEVRTSVLVKEKKLEKLTGRKIWYPEKSGQKTPEGCINPNAWQQILPVLHERGHKVDSTKAEILKPLGDEFADTLLSLREDNKLLGTYLLAMENERQGDIVHPNFNLFKPSTGRMSSSKADE